MDPRKTLSVPKAMQATYDGVVSLTDAFCRAHLDDDYAALARKMAAALSRKRPSPLSSGQARTWACGIVHVLGQVNFLSDKHTQPFMTMAELCRGFGVGESTASAKAKVIRNALNLRTLDPTWMLPSLMASHPLVWMVEINGLLVDLRSAPRGVQEAAFEHGMIPFIPADRD